MNIAANDGAEEALLRVEFGRDVMQGADDPLQFVIHELGAICERIPADLKVLVNTAQKLRVVITLE